MEIALAHDYLTRLGGAERVLAALAKIYPSAPIFTLLYDESRTGASFPASRVRPSRLQKLPKILRRNPKYLLPLLPSVVEEWDFSKFDLVISSSGAFSHGILTPPKTHHLCYVHSPMRFAWDWTHEYLKEQRVGPIRKMAVSYMLKKIRMWDQAASDRADTLIANSRTTERRIKKYFRRDSTVIYPPVDISRFKISKSHKDFFLIVSQLTPYKRIDLAIQLFNKIRRRLVVIGDGPQKAYLEAVSGDTISLLGWKDDETVKEYLQNCRALILPGEEDFGITPVEALACGKPVLAFGFGGAKETILPGITGEFFYEPTSASLENGLASIMKQNYSPSACRKQAEKFSEELFAQQFKKLVRKIQKGRIA